MPEGAVIADRSTPLGNPFVRGRDGDSAYCVALHRALLGGLIALSTAAEIAAQQAHRDFVKTERDRGTLRGKDFACWCRLCPAHKEGLPLGIACTACAPCHCDTLLVVFNG